MRGIEKSLGLIFLFVLTLSFSLIPANAHLAKDEVPRHGAAGTSLEQDSHDHPHSRIIWYQIESVNYTGSQVDRYEQTLSNYTIPIPEPEPIPDANFEDVPFFVIFSFKEVDVVCPTGQNNPYADQIKTKLYENDPHRNIIFTNENNLELTLGLLHYDGSTDLMYFINGTIDKQRGIVNIAGIMDHSNQGICYDTEPFFTFDLTIKCDGTSMNLTSRHPEGYSIYANDAQSHATCLY